MSLLWSVRRVLGLWVRVSVKPEDAAASIAARPRPVCYVLERESRADLAALDMACARVRLPRPERRLLLGAQRADRAYFELARRPGRFGMGKRGGAPRQLTQLVAAATAHSQIDIDLVPVAVFFGRAPDKEQSLWRLLFAEDWGLVGRFRKLLRVIFNGRNTLVHFGEPRRLRDLLVEDAGEARNVRRVLRILRTDLRAQRVSTIGPDLSHRRTMVAQILKTQAVRQAVRRSAPPAADGAARAKARRAGLEQARRYAIEIAANYSQSFVSLMAIALGRLWNRLYRGVEVEHMEQLTEIGDQATVIYVPCHRSHMDYLLLSYVIYRKGFAVPHVAAGINLNMPVIGRFLRMGGAFFLRRSFKGDQLYAAVFTKYLGFMMARGHPLEYFVEGGRSRTGRMLAPRTGMLSMTVRSYLRDPRRPVVFLPVYFGYERIFEGRTYLGELSGQPKKKETVVGLLKATASLLRSEFGKVRVNFGAPIALDELLVSHRPAWRDEPALDEDERPEWFLAAVGDLARRITTGINAAAAVSPVNLIAMAMLATPRQALPEADLAAQADLYRRLLRDAPYAPLVTVTADSGAAMIRYCEGLRLLERQAHPLGDIMRMNANEALRATYYRNNILHLFAMPSLLACCFLSNETMRAADIRRLVWRVYPYVAAELFLCWDEAEVPAVIDALLEAFVRCGLLVAGPDPDEWRRPAPTSPMAMRLSLLAQATIQTLERYYLVIALLLQAGSGALTQEALEQRCHWMAQRMSVLHGLNSPEFFDRAVFRNFIDLLRHREVVRRAADGTLAYGEPLLAVAADAQSALSEQIRHSILQVTLEP